MIWIYQIKSPDTVIDDHLMCCLFCSAFGYSIGQTPTVCFVLPGLSCTTGHLSFTSQVSSFLQTFKSFVMSFDIEGFTLSWPERMMI